MEYQYLCLNLKDKYQNLQLVNVSDVMEMFIYSFYLLQLNSKNITTLYCALTDTINYHIFQCALNENGKLKILKKYVVRYPDMDV